MKLKNDHKIETIGFFGISDFGLSFLEKLVDSKYEIAFVTSKAKPVPHIRDLEKRLNFFCNNNNLRYFGNVNTGDDEIIEACKNVDLCMLGGYDKILKNKILSAPKLGFINTHLGIIPQNRGCNPVMWAILKNLQQGATTYFVNEKIDKGKIIDIQTINERNLNSHDAYSSLSKKTANNILTCLEKIETGYDDIQHAGHERYHRQGMPNSGCVSWFWNHKFIKRFSDSLIFPPYPPMFSWLGEHKIYMSVAGFDMFTNNQLPPGTILKYEKAQLRIKTREGAVICRLWNCDINIQKGEMLEYRKGKHHEIDKFFDMDFLS